ncbi:MAG: O-antigen ligase family protein [Anaeroplasmataceae bacterium]|jgi:O-Antigen ligase.|nr:O-antigen ligase family protein [Anaeroplasmataceae bacterium]
MNILQEKYHQLNLNVLKLTNKKYFNEIYAALLAVVTLLGWQFHNLIGMIVMILFALVALILTKDLKYIIPNCIYFIFMVKDGFVNNSFPIPIIILGSIFFVILLFFSFKDGIHLKKHKSLLGLAGLAIATLLPIFWCKAPEGNEVFYFLFFGNFGYMVLYLIMTNGMKGNGIHLLTVTMSYLALLLAGECGLRVLELKDTVDNVLSLSYYLGWGVCNEAGILICLSIPFSFYLLGKQDKLTGMAFQNLKILIGLLGILITTSRGAYFFGVVEVGILYLVLMFTAKKTRLYQNAFIIYAFVLLIGALSAKSFFIQFIDDILQLVFNTGISDSGRSDLWKVAYSYWNENPLNRLFGPGILCFIQEDETAIGFQNIPMVFHSTFFETIAAGGLVGLFFLILHMIQKYKNLYHCDKFLFIILGIGFFILDIYGMIDNTYHMYYFMIPLVVIMATIDVKIYSTEDQMDISSQRY